VINITITKENYRLNKTRKYF